jgi:L-2,4-diaminobutyric acid acetyltransferase
MTAATRPPAAPTFEHDVLLRSPQVADGARMWQIARDSETLDLNSSYAYLLWCREHAQSCAIAEVDGTVVGFVTGFLRPQSPHTLFVWQVAVDKEHRGRGIGVMMLDALLDHLAPRGVTELQTTVSPDNAGSIAMFTALARRREAELTTQPLFTPSDFPHDHAAEELYTISQGVETN